MAAAVYTAAWAGRSGLGPSGSRAAMAAIVALNCRPRAVLRCARACSATGTGPAWQPWVTSR